MNYTRKSKSSTLHLPPPPPPPTFVLVLLTAIQGSSLLVISVDIASVVATEASRAPHVKMRMLIVNIRNYLSTGEFPAPNSSRSLEAR